MIRVAILGAGIGAQHLEAFRQLPHLFEVAYLVDKDTEKARKIRKDGDVFDVLEDISHALSDPAVDLVDICLPPHLHAEVSLQALAARKHVICEKPLTTSLADAIRVQHAAARTGKQVFPVFQYRWGPPLAQLRHLIDSGMTGAPHMAAVETHWSRGSDYYAVPWRGTWAGEQGGAVLGHAIHSHDLLTYFMGPVAALSAVTTTRVNSIETEDCGAISFEMENGALATSNITLGSATNETRLRFIFDNLTATSGRSPYAPGADDWNFIARDPKFQKCIDEARQAIPPEPVGYVGFFEHVSNALNGVYIGGLSLKDGVASIALVTAIYQAARTQTRVSLPLSEDAALYKGWLP